MTFDANSVQPERPQRSPTGLQTYDRPDPEQPPPPRINLSVRPLLANLGSVERAPAATAFGVGCNTLRHDCSDTNRSDSRSKSNERRRIYRYNVGDKEAPVRPASDRLCTPLSTIIERASSHSSSRSCHTVPSPAPIPPWSKV